MEAIRQYDWNGARYIVLRRDDGSRIEIRGGLDMTPAQAEARCPKPIIEQPVREVLTAADLSDDDLLKEVGLRKLDTTIIAKALL